MKVFVSISKVIMYFSNMPDTVFCVNSSLHLNKAIDIESGHSNIISHFIHGFSFNSRFCSAQLKTNFKWPLSMSIALFKCNDELTQKTVSGMLEKYIITLEMLTKTIGGGNRGT
jgi:hypothetical protein